MNQAPTFNEPLGDQEVGLTSIPDSDESWAKLSDWFEDARVRRWYGGDSHRCSPTQARQRYRERAIGEHAVRAVFITHHHRPIGYLQFYRVDAPQTYQLSSSHDLSNTWALDLFIGEPMWWGAGIGSRVITLLCEYLAHKMNASEVLIDPRADNRRAISAYKKVGFEVIRTMREHEEQDGVRYDCLLMRWSSAHQADTE